MARAITLSEFLQECHYPHLEKTFRSNGINSVDELKTATDAFLLSLGIQGTPIKILREKLLSQFGSEEVQRGADRGLGHGMKQRVHRRPVAVNRLILTQAAA